MKDTTKAEVNKLVTKLQSGLTELLNSDNYRNYLCTMSKFHRYSFNNSLLIQIQCPNATYVAGYTAWETKFNRHVIKGEKAIKILAPFVYECKIEVEKRDENGNLVLDKNGKVIKEIIHTKKKYFRPVCVFDISQTQGEPLPEIKVQELLSGVSNYNRLLQALISFSKVPVSFSEIDGNAKGFYDKSSNSIVIKVGMSESQTVKTLIHEIAHSLLHKDDTLSTRSTKEIEAESVAFVVCNYFGIDTSEYSFNYIAYYNESNDMKELKCSLNKVQKTAALIIDGVSEKLESITIL